MLDKQNLLKLMQYALIEIRYEALHGDKNCKMIGQLADLIHNLPLSLLDGKTSDTEKLQNLIEKSENHPWLNQWVLTNLAKMES